MVWAGPVDHSVYFPATGTRPAFYVLAQTPGREAEKCFASPPFSNLKSSREGMSLLPKKRLLAIAVIALSFAARGSAQNAPGGPGAMPTWTAGSKEAVGTATATESHVWFTLEVGILTEVYYPRLDTENLRTLEFAVSDGKTTWAESRDLKHSLERLNNDALLYRQTSSEPSGKFKIQKTYVSDPQRDAVLIEVTLAAPAGGELWGAAEACLNQRREWCDGVCPG